MQPPTPVVVATNGDSSQSLDTIVNSPSRYLEGISSEAANNASRLLQDALDQPGCLERGKCIRRLKRIAQYHNVAPPSFECTGLLMDNANQPFTGGNFADVYRGTFNDEPVAIKVIRIFDTNPDIQKVLKAFWHEAVVWRQLQHPNILKFLGVNRSILQGRISLISPWMKNGNLRDFLKIHPAHDRLQALHDIMKGVIFLHEQAPPIVHADIRCANILVQDSLQCCLGDFGIAVVAEATLGTNDPSGGAKGATRWMPPEALLARMTGDPGESLPARDIWSIGCTIIELYSGNPPYHGLREMFASIKTTQKQPPNFPTIGTNAPSLIRDVIVPKCLECEAEKRPTAEAVLNLLAPLL